MFAFNFIYVYLQHGIYAIRLYIFSIQYKILIKCCRFYTKNDNYKLNIHRICIAAASVITIFIEE